MGEPSEITSPGLLDFNGLKQALEVACTETLVVVSLNNLEEECGSVLNRLGEDLKKITFVIIVNQDLKLL
jgi:hypothetical protein